MFYSTNKIFSLIIILFFLFSFHSSAQRLERFGSNGISYTVIKTLYGTVPTHNISSVFANDTFTYFIFLWIPDSIKEIGIRMLSPVPELAMPDQGEMETPDYAERAGTKKFFDPFIFLEQAQDASAPEDAFAKNKTLHWKMLGQNDNSTDVTAQPTGEKKNSLLRLYDAPEKNIRLTRGLYRVCFRGYRGKQPAGTFLLQVGIYEMMPGLRLYKITD